jgi:transcriptional regulator with XRE-family HTH domain
MSKFGSFLAKSRERAKMQQADLAEVIGKSRTYVSGMEKGRIRPPSKGDCARLEDALGVKPGALWELGRPERLKDLDPDLYAWHVQEVAEATGSLSPEELELVEATRRSTLHAPAVARYVQVLGTVEFQPTPLEIELLAFVRKLDELDHPEVTPTSWCLKEALRAELAGKPGVLEQHQYLETRFELADTADRVRQDYDGETPRPGSFVRRFIREWGFRGRGGQTCAGYLVRAVHTARLEQAGEAGLRGRVRASLAEASDDVRRIHWAQRVLDDPLGGVRVVVDHALSLGDAADLVAYKRELARRIRPILRALLESEQDGRADVRGLREVAEGLQREWARLLPDQPFPTEASISRELARDAE